MNTYLQQKFFTLVGLQALIFIVSAAAGLAGALTSNKLLLAAGVAVLALSIILSPAIALARVVSKTTSHEVGQKSAGRANE